MLDTKEQIEALEGEIEKIVIDATGEAGDYAAEFAAYAAEATAVAVQRGDADAVNRLDAMARTVAETIKEMGEQASDQILTRLTDLARVLIALARVTGAVA